MRDEIKILPCGCKIGRSKGGLWFYDFYCEIHLAKVLDEDGHFSQELARKMVEELNKEMKGVKLE